jgi:hypothetical protein
LMFSSETQPRSFRIQMTEPERLSRVSDGFRRLPARSRNVLVCPSPFVLVVNLGDFNLFCANKRAPTGTFSSTSETERDRLTVFTWPRVDVLRIDPQVGPGSGATRCVQVLPLVSFLFPSSVFVLESPVLPEFASLGTFHPRTFSFLDGFLLPRTSPWGPAAPLVGFRTGG